jgi:pimeloyl-ACP methyl ester carboxylesterase
MPKESNTNWLDSAEVLAVAFHPRHESRTTGGTAGYESLAIPVAPGITVGGRFYRAGKDRPTMLFFHGNGEIVADYDDLAPQYVALGINFLPVDYRGYGTSTGSPTISAMLADARAIFDFVANRLTDQGYTNRVVVMGRSLGSASALELASSCPDKLAGLIIESGFSDTVALMKRLGAGVPAGGISDTVLRQSEKIKGYNGPTLIIHGTADFIIPVADADALYATCGSKNKKILKVKGAGHNDLLYVGYKEYMQAVRDLFDGLRK